MKMFPTLRKKILLLKCRLMSKPIKMRRCISCREIKNKSEMLRIVKKSDEIFELDFSGNSDGRGAYVCKNLICANNNKKRKNLDRSFKMKVPADIYDKIISAVDENHE